MNATMTYRVDHHGTSGNWYPIEGGIRTMHDALILAQSVKSEGYGVRVVRESDSTIAVNAPWQESLDWSVAS